MKNVLLLFAFIALICLIKISFIGVAIYPKNYSTFEIKGDIDVSGNVDTEINTRQPIEVEVIQ